MKIENFQVKQNLTNYFAALNIEDRKSLIREEVSDCTRLGTSKLTKEILTELVLQPRASRKLRL